MAVTHRKTLSFPSGIHDDAASLLCCQLRDMPIEAGSAEAPIPGMSICRLEVAGVLWSGSVPETTTQVRKQWDAGI